MTIAELIEALQKHNPKFVVKFRVGIGDDTQELDIDVVTTWGDEVFLS